MGKTNRDNSCEKVAWLDSISFRALIYTFKGELEQKISERKIRTGTDVDEGHVDSISSKSYIGALQKLEWAGLEVTPIVVVVKPNGFSNGVEFILVDDSVRIGTLSRGKF